jgi:pimeloyl-ACP methyl ester carboxylesterase
MPTLRAAFYLIAVSLLAALTPPLRASAAPPACSPAVTAPAPDAARKLIVIGFMGGNVRSTNYLHREALMARELQQRFPNALHAAVFANHDAANALRTLLALLDQNRDGCLSPEEKTSARIVLYGHSWGASETVTLARRLNALHIPVLLTVQVDSVQKPAEDDAIIPPNVHQAINFFETEGILHGRRVIQAADPARTTILGNFQSSYRTTPVALNGFPWFARTFMKQHIEIENDPAVWDQIEALIGAKVL